MEDESPSLHNVHQAKSSSGKQVKNDSPDSEAPRYNPNNVAVQIVEQRAVRAAVPGNTIHEDDMSMPIRNLMRIIRRMLPPDAKVSDEAKEVIQMCVSEFISFITTEANNRCQKEHRKILTAEDLLGAMDTLGFDDYVQPLVLFLRRYRHNEVQSFGHQVPPRQSVVVNHVPLPLSSSLSQSFGRQVCPRQNIAINHMPLPLSPSFPQSLGHQVPSQQSVAINHVSLPSPPSLLSSEPQVTSSSCPNFSIGSSLYQRMLNLTNTHGSYNDGSSSSNSAGGGALTKFDPFIMHKYE
ncbi:hypothetical protein RJT34_16608 [Clitoria ternatea]|uniref:Transcription factor CBF/NF-Y/archaeal histone domain-containing protein n=1 Tax=Clitoria ternatea TaxID=43366 RepID=A0AAN9PCE0_CLITE